MTPPRTNGLGCSPTPVRPSVRPKLSEPEDLKAKHTRSPKSKPGDTFGRLTLVSIVPGQGSRRWLCRCSCGIEKVIRQQSLREGCTASCGCLRMDLVGAKNRTHGLSGTHPLYKLWLNMRDRCNRPANKSFYLYGGRGVKVDPAWDSFERFCADMGDRPSPKHSLDRLDGLGNYAPGNVRWANPTQQSRSRLNVPKYTFEGTSLTLPEWSEVLSIPHKALYTRLTRQGLTVEQAFTTPSRYSRGFQV